MKRKVKKNAVLRKGFGYTKQIPRTWRRLTSSHDDYQFMSPVLANSFPKSGTHLLLQILETLPGVTTYGSFIASMPSITFKERSEKSHLRLLGRMIPGEVVPAHLFYHPLFSTKITNKNAVHFFIYRDLRDVAISEAHYLFDMNRWHRMHRYYRALPTLDERITLAIEGDSDPNNPYDYPNIAERFSRYKGWLRSEDVCAVKFEDLRSSMREEYIRDMIIFYAQKCLAEIDVDKVTQAVMKNINPANSHTFRRGQVGEWKDNFTDEHKDLMKSVAGNLLIELCYEPDLAW